MDAITDGWAYGRSARSIQFVKFEQMLGRPLTEVQREYGLGRDGRTPLQTPTKRAPELLAAA